MSKEDGDKSNTWLTYSGSDGPESIFLCFRRRRSGQDLKGVWLKVIIMDPSAPRGSWLLGKVTATYPDKKGLVRTVQLKTKTGYLERPVTKLLVEA